jgi:hypothetical protein
MSCAPLYASFGYRGAEKHLIEGVRCAELFGRKGYDRTMLGRALDRSAMPLRTQHARECVRSTSLE